MSASTATHPSIVNAPIARAASPSPFWPTLLWVTIQFGLLVLGAWRVPLAARWPVPAEKLALHEMAIGQILAASLFLPIFFRTFTSAVMVIVTAPLFLLLAAAVAARADTPGFIGCTVYVCFWLLACGVWNAAIRTAGGRMYLVASAVLLTGGGLAAAYLRREFGLPSQSFEWFSVAAAGPATGAIVLLETGLSAGTAWAELGIILVSGGLAWVGGRWMGRRGAPKGSTQPGEPLASTAPNDA